MNLTLTDVVTESLITRRSSLKIVLDGLNGIKNESNTSQQSQNIKNGVTTISDELDCINLELGRRIVQDVDGSLSVTK